MTGLGEYKTPLMNPLHYTSPLSISRVVLLLLGVLVVLDLASIWSSFLQIDLLEQMQAGVLFSDAELTANDDRESALGTTYMLLYFTTAIVFLTWFHRVWKNAHWMAQSQGELSPKYSPAWAVWSFIVPIISLVRPYQIMRDTWEYGAPDHARGRHGLLQGWWALWIIGNIIGQITWRMSNTTDLGGLITLTNLQMTASVLDIPAAILAMTIVFKQTQFQVERVERTHEVAETFA